MISSGKLKNISIKGLILIRQLVGATDHYPAVKQPSAANFLKNFLSKMDGFIIIIKKTAAEISVVIQTFLLVLKTKMISIVFTHKMFRFYISC